jgi:hypothetical protein
MVNGVSGGGGGGGGGEMKETAIYTQKVVSGIE